MNKRKSIIIVAIILVALIIGGILGIKIYKTNKYNAKLEEMKAQYNEEQKECIQIGLTNNYIYVVRKDENNEPIKDSQWKVTDREGKEIATFTINEEGVGGVVGLEDGEYYLQEIYAPENVERDDYKYEVSLSSKEPRFRLSKAYGDTEGTFLIVLKDLNGDPVEGIQYDVYNSKNEKILTVTTNAKGLAGGYNFDDGVYYIVEKSNPKNKYKMFIQNSSLERFDLTYTRESI